MPHRHLQCGEAPPRDSEHADIPVRPCLMRQPIDDLFFILLLLLRVLTLRRLSLAGAKSANVYAHAHIASPRKIGVFRIVSCCGPIIFSVWQIFEECRKLLSGFGAIWHVESRGQTYSIFHWNPRVHYADAVGWRGRRFNGRHKSRNSESEAEDPECLGQRSLRDCTRTMTRSQSDAPCSRRMARRSIPSCSAFLYR